MPPADDAAAGAAAAALQAQSNPDPSAHLPLLPACGNGERRASNVHDSNGKSCSSGVCVQDFPLHSASNPLPAGDEPETPRLDGAGDLSDIDDFDDVFITKMENAGPVLHSAAAALQAAWRGVSTRAAVAWQAAFREADRQHAAQAAFRATLGPCERLRHDVACNPDEADYILWPVHRIQDAWRDLRCRENEWWEQLFRGRRPLPPSFDRAKRAEMHGAWRIARARAAAARDANVAARAAAEAAALSAATTVWAGTRARDLPAIEGRAIALQRAWRRLREAWRSHWERRGYTDLKGLLAQGWHPIPPLDCRLLCRLRQDAARRYSDGLQWHRERRLRERRLACEQRAAARIRAAALRAAHRRLAPKWRAAARIEAAFRARLAPKVRAAVGVQSAARRFFAGRRAAEMIMAEGRDAAATLIQLYTLLMLDRRRLVAVARLRVLLTEVSTLGHDEVPPPPAQQALSSPTGTEHLGTTDGSMRGRKSASSAARARERRVRDSRLPTIVSGIASLRLRAGHLPAAAQLRALLAPLLVPVGSFGARSCEELVAHIALRTARIESDDPATAYALLRAVAGELAFYGNLARDTRGFTAAEIVAESPAYFTGLARRLGVYLKKVEERGALVPIPTDLELGDEYFSFADSINAAAAKHSAPAASLEAPTAAHLRAAAHAIGVPLGWLQRIGYRDSSGTDSSDAASDTVDIDGGGGCCSDAD